MMLPASEIDLTAVKYIPENIQGFNSLYLYVRYIVLSTIMYCFE